MLDNLKKQKKNDWQSRPPIVVVLGHVDHGKSSLLEAIRDFKITAGESGGITQHIGAYQVQVDNPSAGSGRGKITFLDTPGHEAFSQMRSRGAKVADIAILIIDATEGVKPQTKEAISHIKQAGIPVITALNKMDKSGADPEKVKRELEKEDFLVESLGGKIPCVEISAITKKGIIGLLDLILLIAEMEGLKADFQKPAEGVIVESYLDNLRGPTATLLLTEGCLRAGDVIGTESAFVKIKNIENFQKISIEKAFPSDPVIIFGFNQAPKVGEKFKAFSDLEKALANIKDLAKNNQKKAHGLPQKAPEEINQGQKTLCLILKADVLGSIEAIEGILESLPQEKIVLKILKVEVGNINESDIKLSIGSQAIILGFRVKMDAVAKKMAEREKPRIKFFEVIYDLVEDLRKIMEKNVDLEEIRTDLGKLKVLVKFLTEKNRQIIGGKVIEGIIKKGALIEVFRGEKGNEEKIGKGKMINLQKNKKSADEIRKGEECGILFEGIKIEEGDILLFYTKERVRGEL
jgi:translation initiation factor IF-2